MKRCIHRMLIVICLAGVLPFWGAARVGATHHETAGAVPMEPTAPNGPGPAPQFLRDLPALQGLIAPGDGWTIGGGFLYWASCPGADTGGGYLRRWPLRGGTVLTIVNGRFCGGNWAADETGLYYATGSQILRRSTSNPFRVDTLAASSWPSGQIVLDNGTTLWRDYIFWIANDTLYSAHKHTFQQLAAPEPLGANAHSLLFADNNRFYWFANGGLHTALKPCLAFGGGACIKDVVAAESGQHVLDATRTSSLPLQTTFPLWSSGINIRGIWCRFNNTGQVCSPSTSYSSPLNNTVGRLTTDGEFLFWLENRQVCQPGLFCFWSDQGRLMKWRLNSSSLGTDPFDEPQQIACQQCFADYAIPGFPGTVEVHNGWVYFDTNRGLSRLRADAPPISADFVAHSIEVTQAVQNINNDVPLVANKATVARVYAQKLQGPTTTGVAAVLHGTRANGTALPGSPLRPINGGQSLTVNNGVPNRGASQGSWMFRLPDSWTEAGAINVRSEIDPQRIWADPNQANNSLVRTVNFTRKAPVCIVTVPVRTHAPPAAHNDPSLYRMVDITRQLMPASDVWLYHQHTDVAQLEARFGIPPWKYEPYAVPAKGDAILRALWLRDALSDDPDACDDAGARTHYVGLVHAATPTGTNLGLGSRPGAELYMKLADMALLNTQPFWQVQAFNTLVHELGHNYDRRHVNCGGPANADPGYPYVDAMGTNCVLDDGRRAGNPIPAEQRYYGFDTHSLTPFDPALTADYMAYGAPYWVSDYTWRGVFNAINTARPAIATTLQLSEASAIVYLTGAVDPATNSGSLEYAWTVPAQALSAGMRRKLVLAPQVKTVLTQGPDTYTLRLRDAAGTLLDERAVTLQAAEDDEATVQSFMLQFPAPTAVVARLELVSNNTVIASLEPGGAMPEVTMLSPAGGETAADELSIAWNASDADGTDKLLYTVQYSPDDGQYWQTIAAGLPDTSGGGVTTLNLNTLSELPGGTTNARVRVLASDGYHTSVATSAPFTLQAQAPQPHIDAPSATSFAAGEPVIVRGGATDVQDGGLAGEALQWTLDGQALGAGQDHTLQGLAPGSYTLGLTAHNSHGRSAEVSSTFTVAPLAVPYAADPLLDGSCDDAGYADAPQLPLKPYANGSQGYAHMIRSNNSVYVCFVGLQRTAGASPGTMAGVRIDSDYSRDAQPQAGDYLFFMGENGVFQAHQGTGTDYAAIEPNGVYGQVSATDTHWMAELRLDASVFGGWNKLVGLSVEQVWVNAGNDAYAWPHTVVWNDPSTWGAVALGELPQVTALTPASAAVGAGDTLITITGAGFVGGAVVEFDGIALATTVISATELQATIPAAQLTTAGTFNLAVAHPGLAAAATLFPFQVTNPLPQLDSATLRGNVLTLTGSNFAPGATVQFNGHEYQASGSATSLSVTLNSADRIGAFETPVTVFNPGPGGGVSNVISLAGQKIYLPLVRR